MISFIGSLKNTIFSQYIYMSEGKPSAPKKPAGKPPAGKPPAGKPSAVAGGTPPPEKTKEQKKKEGFKQKLAKTFAAFHGFWTPILGLFVLMSIGFFFSGIEDKDIISYSLLIFVTLMILFYSWRELLVNNDEHPENKKVHWLLKPFLVLFRFLVATIPQTITIIQVIVIMVYFNKYKNLIYNDQKQIPDIFHTFNMGLFVIMLGQIGLINWYLSQNIAAGNTFFQKSFLPIFVIIATISSALMVELYVIVRHFLTDG
jgi:hypothetical protein